MKKPLSILSPEEARSYLLWLLARRDYPRVTLERKLKMRGLDAAAIASLLDDLKERGIYREDSFARVKTRELLRKGDAPRMVKSKLGALKCKVADADISRAFDEIGGSVEDGVREMVRKAIRKAVRGGASAASLGRDFENKTIRSLAAKGYGISDIKKAIATEKASDSDPDSQSSDEKP